MTAWTHIPCPVCGIEHRDDCENRFERGESRKCDCENGCNNCDWTGTLLLVVGGHKKYRRVTVRRPQ